ncbi:MAG: glycosyltransferase [Desulfobacteraceae bacterium]|nr:glycosyltransferase [Desulfobacteraceae bacterium]MBC2719858.1 glycosyltransferase [Desulfobacteraceae bacterium]
MNRKIKILRIIARLNIGGPAIHATLLTQGLDPDQFQSVLVTGKVSAKEGDMSYFADAYGIKPIIIFDLQREISIINDVRSFLSIFRILNQEKPDIVHTHTAKAGTIGRITAFIHNLIYGDKIRVVHTFHGHVFHGYFGRMMSTIFILTERILAKITDIIIVISESQKNEIVNKYRIVRASNVRVIKLGFDLKPFLSGKDHLGESTQICNSGESKMASPELQIGIVGRLVPIKNHKMFLESAKIFLEQNPSIKATFLIIGDGELREDLIAYCKQQGLSDHVQFCGWQKKLPEIYSNLDIVALTSNNEGTPVSLIEAMACSVPVIATDVGGVRDLLGNSQLDVVSDGFKICERGIICRKKDAKGFAGGIKYIVNNKGLREKKARAAKSFVMQNFSKKRLLRDIESLYFELLDQDSYSQSISFVRPLTKSTSHNIKVLQIYKDYYPPVIGGIEQHINCLCHGLKPYGIQTEVLVSNTGPITSIYYDNSIKITKVGEHGRLQSAPITPSFFYHLKALSNDADILHFHFPNPTAELSLILSKIKKPYIITYHSDIVKQKELLAFYSPFMFHFLKHAKFIMPTSSNYLMTSNTLQKVKDRCVVNPLGIDFNRFQQKERFSNAVFDIRQKYGDRIILFIGKMRYYKGLRHLILAMKRVKGTLLIIGEGEPVESCMRALSKDLSLSDRVVFLGAADDEMRDTLLHASDLLVLPSIYRSEAFGLVLLEAMACGKPVISTELGTGTSFVNVHNKTGMVVPPKDSNALANAICHLLENKDLCRKYGKAGKSRVQKYFTNEAMFERTIKVYNEALK